MLICQIVEQIIPLGRNMREQVATQYNANRTRTSPERDFESLRRKFKNLYRKPKPIDRGEVPLRMRPVVWAKEIQARIEGAGGVHTLHDGLDGGEDDVAFEAEVDEATTPIATSRSGAAEQTTSSTDGGGGRNVPDGDDSSAATAESGDDSDAVGVGVGNGSEEVFPGTSQARGRDEFSQYAHRETPATDPASNIQLTGTPATAPASNTQLMGTIMTRSGHADAILAADLEISAGDSFDDGGSVTNATATQPQTPTPRSTTPASSQSGTSANSIGDNGASLRHGKQQTVRQEAVATASNGATLHRDANREEQGAREADENLNLSAMSNRLGGQDLRVFRDNVEAMTQNMLNANGKRSPTEGSRTDGSTNGTSYAKATRVRAKQRPHEMRNEIDDLEQRQTASGSELMSMLLFLQKESERRAETEERRRRAERDERLEAEKRERAEREEIRREESNVAEQRRQDDHEAARVLQEEQRRQDTARQARMDQDRGETEMKYEGEELTEEMSHQVLQLLCMNSPRDLSTS
ncbi:hypothetical protein ON010_g6507 [Phytophthora cinnamomi]|nr:hypothetical protein ON010_g6507 [Phytophthora cinnamomi]